MKSGTKKTPTWRLILAASVTLALISAWVLRPPASERPTAAPLPPPPSPAATALRPPAGNPVVPVDLTARLDDLAARLGAATDPVESRKLLAELRAALDALPPEIASREVQTFLHAGRDAPTRLDVTLKPGGALADASSLRVFLLDYLGQIDRPAAAALARQVLSAPTSPDEWAVSLRNVAWGDDSPAARTFLTQKVGELIANPAWRQNPSAGFLEAFDVIVHTRATELAPQLTELVRNKENRTLGHAAYLTLDRLTIAAPAETLELLAAQPDLMAGREQTRANYFARADIRDPRQRALLEQYLLDPRRAAQELQTFAGIYPNANFMISNNLLTTTPTPAQPEIAGHDRAALTTVEEWLTDPRFTALRPQLEQVRTRLGEFVRQASAP